MFKIPPQGRSKKVAYRTVENSSKESLEYGSQSDRDNGAEGSGRRREHTSSRYYEHNRQGGQQGNKEQRYKKKQPTSRRSTLPNTAPEKTTNEEPKRAPVRSTRKPEKGKQEKGKHQMGKRKGKRKETPKARSEQQNYWQNVPKDYRDNVSTYAKYIDRLFQELGLPNHLRSEKALKVLLFMAREFHPDKINDPPEVKKAKAQAWSKFQEIRKTILDTEKDEEYIIPGGVRDYFGRALTNTVVKETELRKKGKSDQEVEQAIRDEIRGVLMEAINKRTEKLVVANKEQEEREKEAQKDEGYGKQYYSDSSKDTSSEGSTTNERDTEESTERIKKEDTTKESSTSQKYTYKIPATYHQPDPSTTSQPYTYANPYSTAQPSGYKPQYISTAGPNRVLHRTLSHSDSAAPNGTWSHDQVLDYLARYSTYDQQRKAQQH